MAKVSSKNQVTLPVDVLRAAGLRPGDEVTVRSAGIATGIYRPDELNELRDEWGH